MELVPAAEFQRKIGHYQEKVLFEPVGVTRNGRARVVLLSAAEYRWSKWLDRQVLSVGELSDEDLAAIATAEVPTEHASLNSELPA